MSTTGHHDSHTPEDIRQLWQTPKWFFDYWNLSYDFTLDIAASEVNHLCDSYITEHDNAFEYDFSLHAGEYVWCNPPYRDINPWIELACRNADEHNVGTVLLIPADVSTSWFKAASTTASEIVFVTGGRLSFVRADTQVPIGGNTKGSVVVIYHPNRFKGSSPEVVFSDRDWMKRVMEDRYEDS